MRGFFPLCDLGHTPYLDEEKIPLTQVFLDNILLLLVLGLAVPIVLYTIWRLFEIATIPVAQ